MRKTLDPLANHAHAGIPESNKEETTNLNCRQESFDNIPHATVRFSKMGR